jgi:hypothetical protein
VAEINGHSDAQCSVYFFPSALEAVFTDEKRRLSGHLSIKPW